MNRHPVILPAGLARCPATRTVYCVRADHCARALVDAKGRFTQDYSAEPRGPHGCSHYIDAASHRPAPVPAGPKVHEALS